MLDFPFLSLLLSQDLGLQGTSLNDILYKNAAFLNLVDPISHELLLGLARDLQCPKRVGVMENYFFQNVTDATFINKYYDPALDRSKLQHVHIYSPRLGSCVVFVMSL